MPHAVAILGINHTMNALPVNITFKDIIPTNP